MIQRIQSLYFTIILLLSLLFLRGSVLKFADESGKAVRLLMTGYLTDQNGQTLPQAVNMLPIILILILLALLSVIIILLYKNRKTQLVLAKLEIGISSLFAIVLAWFAYSISSEYKMTIIPGLKMVIPLIIIILSILAFRGILKDDHLVKSYDRLR